MEIKEIKENMEIMEKMEIMENYCSGKLEQETPKVDTETPQKKVINRRIWCSREDQILRQAIQQWGTNWCRIALEIGDRNPSQCAQRWKRIKPSQLKTRKVWTPSEDKQLVQLVKEYKQNWKLVAQLLKNRTGKQVRERYRNKLDPNIAQGPWLKEEDEKIFQYYQQYGSRWTQISQLLGGRSENMIKNRFYTHIRKHYMNIENPYYVVPNMEDFKEQSNSTPTRQNATDEKTPPPPPIVPPIRKKAAQTKSLLPKLAQTNSQSIETPKQDKEVQKAEIKNSTISQVNYIDHERAYNNLITAKLQEMMSQPQTLSIQFQPTLNIMTGQLFSFPVFLQYQPISNLIL